MPVADLIRQRAVRPLERMVFVEYLIGQRAVRPLERMNSPLENRKVRLRGLGGQSACGVRCTCASATWKSAHQIRNRHDSPLEDREISIRELGSRCVQP